MTAAAMKRSKFSEAQSAFVLKQRGGSVHLNSSTRLLSGASAGFMPLREAAG